MTKHSFSRLLSTFTLAALTALTVGCSSEPSVDTIAANLCACEALSEPMTEAELAQCRTQAAQFLDRQPPACLECMDGKLGDGATEAACSSADAACGAVCGGDEGEGGDDD